MANVVTARLLVGVIIVTNIPVFQLLTRALDRRFDGRPELHLFVVMVR